MGKSELRIRELCREKNMTQADLATKLGIRRDSFSQALSRNNLDMDYLRRIATALDIPIWQLFVAPEEVQGDGINITCPHCGKPIKIHIQADKNNG